MFSTSGQRVIDNVCSTGFVWKPNSSVNIPLNYTSWLGGDPNCYHQVNGYESCITLLNSAQYNWLDVMCTQPACPICQIDV